MLSAIKAAVKVAKHPEESKHTANDTQQLLYFEDLLGQTVTTEAEFMTLRISFKCTLFSHIYLKTYF